MTSSTMPDSYYKTLLIEGKGKKLQELAALASKDRTPSESKRFAVEAQAILRDLAEIDDKLMLAADAPVGGLDYSVDAEMYAAIVRYLTQLNRPSSESDITKELIRGRFRGYKEGERKMAIRVGRCIRSYVVGKPSENPKLKYKNRLVGLPEWPDKMFS